MIPKIVWQTHEWEYENLPPNFKSASLTWKNLNPEWEYRYVDAAERAKQVESFDSTFYLFYRHMDKTSQADLWRYITVYQNGGVYSDMDSICSKPLDYTLRKIKQNTEILVTPIGDDGVVNNSNFGAKKESTILGDILDQIYVLPQKVSLTSVLNMVDRDFTLVEAIQHQIKLHPKDFSSVVLNNKEITSFEYVGPIHTSDIKNLDYRVPESFVVDFYGEPKLYIDLAAEHGWKLV